MAHNTLSEKLDHIQSNELGFPFDEEALWANLESKMDRRIVFTRRWMIAASIFLLVFLAPFTLLREWTTSMPSELVVEEVVTVPDQTAVAVVENTKEPKEEIKREPVSLPTLSRIDVKPEIASLGAVQLASATPIHIQKEEEPLQQFAAQDISVIQASLKGSSTETGRNMSIRAQWQTSPTEVNVNYQALKIKLYEKKN